MIKWIKVFFEKYVVQIFVVIVGSTAFIEALDMIEGRYLTEDKIVLEVQQDFEESDSHFVFWTRGISDKPYVLTGVRIRTDRPSTQVKLQYGDLRKPLLLSSNPNLKEHHYAISEQEIGKISKDAGSLWESKSPFFILVEFEEVVPFSALKGCEFSGFKGDSITEGTSPSNISCEIEDLGYSTRKEIVLYTFYIGSITFMLALIVWLFRLWKNRKRNGVFVERSSTD